MTPAEWISLAERCEKATGPDREIDVEIALALDWHDPAVLSEPIRKTVPLYPNVAEFVTRCADRYGSIYNVALPRWTASLDAITTLVERESPGCGWVVDRAPADATLHGELVLPSGRIMQHGDYWSYEGWPECSAATPALALCAAFCRVLAEQETNR